MATGASRTSRNTNDISEQNEEARWGLKQGKPVVANCSRTRHENVENSLYLLDAVRDLSGTVITGHNTITKCPSIVSRLLVDS